MSDIDMTDAAVPQDSSRNEISKATIDNDRNNDTFAIPPSFDLGNLLVTSSAPLPPNPSPAVLQSTAQKAAQSLISELLLTCPIRTSSSTSASASVLMTLPTPTTALPREKHLPPPRSERPKTKWERFAEKKGIGKGKRGENGEGGKKVYDEERGEWVDKYGYKGKGKRDDEEEWIVEVDDDKDKKKKGSGQADAGGLRQGKRERMEQARRNERKMRANERREGKLRRATGAT